MEVASILQNLSSREIMVRFYKTVLYYSHYFKSNVEVVGPEMSMFLIFGNESNSFHFKFEIFTKIIKIKRLQILNCFLRIHNLNILLVLYNIHGI